MNRFVTGFLSLGLTRVLSRRRIDRFFDTLPKPAATTPSVDPCICALQMQATVYSGLHQWLTELDRIFSNAASQGVNLICLPELYAMTPYLLHPLAHPALSYLPRFSSDNSTSTSSQPFSLFPLLAPFGFVNEIYEEIIVRFARRYQMWIFGGTGFVPDHGHVYNRGFLVSPEGCITARQNKLHLTCEEISLGLTPGDHLQIVPTPIGNIALSVCMDATYFETFRVAKAQGADYIIVPIGDMAEFDHWLALRGVPMRVNETGLTAIKPALVSAPDFPILFTGKAEICFPDSTGLSNAATASATGFGQVTCRFPLQALRSSSHGPFLRSNPAFSRNYFRALECFCQTKIKGDPL